MNITISKMAWFISKNNTNRNTNSIKNMTNMVTLFIETIRNMGWNDTFLSGIMILFCFRSKGRFSSHKKGLWSSWSGIRTGLWSGTGTGTGQVRRCLHEHVRWYQKHFRNILMRLNMTKHNTNNMNTTNNKMVANRLNIKPNMPNIRNRILRNINLFMKNMFKKVTNKNKMFLNKNTNSSSISNSV